MPYTVRRVVGFAMTFDNRPGLLAEVLEGVRSEGIDLLVAAGWEDGSRATLLGVPVDPALARSAAARHGVAVQEKDYILVEGVDRPGALVEFAQKLAGRGINVHTMHALAVGGKFGAIFTLDAADIKTVLGWYS